ncbi:hypothetical protein ATANTOWER_007862 [Ataeniobius toweri]|uniref:Uncharacterized protein n=1 Tax=Ataeniobius toweri TaxID=208326 RepID=A0ABU7C6H8_9TELE|nr:hypothetical protein [Ataeniobius toweri]
MSSASFSASAGNEQTQLNRMMPDSMECAEDSSYQDFKDAQKTLKSGTEIGEAAKRLSSKCFAPPPRCCAAL